FWEGLKLVRLSSDRLSIAESVDRLPTIATRKKEPLPATPIAPGGFPVNAGDNPIEAPFIFKRGDWYYLFVSIDYCCRGANSTYKMIVGRAKSVAGPYEDKESVPLARGGGTVLLAGDDKWYGVGHNAVANFDGTDYIVFHAYDASDERGRAKLRIEKLAWDAAGWPSIATKNP
ncbi:MAG: family 43 glycosylhydrolase, partial [Opitutaceae bacterium]